MMKTHGYKRLCVSIGQAGDRTDQALESLSEEVLHAAPDRVLLRRISGYERGREIDEVPLMMQNHLQSLGFPTQHTSLCLNEIDALNQAEAWANGEDLVIHLIHIEREPVQQWLAHRNAL